MLIKPLGNKVLILHDTHKCASQWHIHLTSQTPAPSAARSLGKTNPMKLTSNQRTDLQQTAA